jgi:hypothetical protein
MRSLGSIARALACDGGARVADHTGGARRMRCATRPPRSQEHAMETQELARKLVKMCNEGHNFEVMETMYTPDVVSVEGDGAETVGKQQVIDKSRRWQAENNIKSQVVRGPFFNGPSHFAAHFTVEVTRKATGENLKIEEVGIYTVKDGLLAREEFYYDGDH